MSVKDNASIALIPSGYKSLKVYSVIPDDGNGDFTFSRGSTATRVAASGLLETVASGVPRLDYPLVGGVVQTCPALLLEPSRTNIQGYSESFSNWSKVNVTELSNQTVSPDGNQTADSVKENSGTNSKYIYLNESVTSGNDYTYSVFAKYNGTRYIQLTGSTGFGTGHVNFDLQDGIITLESSILDASITKYPNNWYRITLKLSCTTTTTSGRFLIALINSANAGRVASYAGDTSKGVYLWGAQFEISDYPTSYIPNLSSGSTTRSADLCIDSGTSAEININEGVLFFESAALADDLTFRQITLNDGSTNTILIGYRTQSNRIYAQIVKENASQTFISFDVTDITQFHKIALKYATNSVALWIDGVQRAIDTTANMPTALNSLDLRGTTGGAQFYGKLKQIMVFKTALTNSELQTLTS